MIVFNYDGTVNPCDEFPEKGFIIYDDNAIIPDYFDFKNPDHLKYSRFYFANYNYCYYHREDGPAIIHADRMGSWYYNEYDVTDKVHQWAKERNIDIDNMTDIDKIALKFDIAGFVK